MDDFTHYQLGDGDIRHPSVQQFVLEAPVSFEPTQNAFPQVPPVVGDTESQYSGSNPRVPAGPPGEIQPSYVFKHVRVATDGDSSTRQNAGKRKAGSMSAHLRQYRLNPSSSSTGHAHVPAGSKSHPPVPIMTDPTQARSNTSVSSRSYHSPTPIRFMVMSRLPRLPPSEIQAHMARFMVMQMSWTPLIDRMVMLALSYAGSTNLFLIDAELVRSINVATEIFIPAAACLEIEYIDERGVGTHLSLYNPAGLQIFFAPFIKAHLDHFRSIGEREAHQIIFAQDGTSLLDPNMESSELAAAVADFLHDKTFLNTFDAGGDILMCQAPCVKKLVRRLYWEGPYPFSEFPPWTTEVPEGAICSVATFFLAILGQYRSGFRNEMESTSSSAEWRTYYANVSAMIVYLNGLTSSSHIFRIFRQTLFNEIQSLREPSTAEGHPDSDAIFYPRRDDNLSGYT